MVEDRAIVLKGTTTPKIRVVVGQAAWGTAVVRVANKTGVGWKWESKEFHSWNDEAMEIAVGKFEPKDLDQHMLVVDLVITPEQKGDWMNAEVTVLQHGNAVLGGRFRPVDEESDARVERFRRSGMMVFA